MAKKIDAYIKLQVPAGKANPSPPIGPALGQKGVNIMEFCKAFNAATQKMEVGQPIPVVITVYSDRSFTFVMKTPPATYLLKKAAGLKSGSPRPNTQKVGKVTRAQLEEIEQPGTARRLAGPRQAVALGDGIDGAGLAGVRSAHEGHLRTEIGRKLAGCGSAGQEATL